VKSDRQFYDASKIKDNWSDPSEREKIIKYGIDDGDDALNIYEIMVPSYFYLTQSIPKGFQAIINSASGSWINQLFLRSYLQDFKSIPKACDANPFQGAISYGVPSVYTNCFKQDVASLYPSIMRQYGICDTDKDPNKYFSEVVEYFTLERLENKRLAKETGKPYYKAMEQAQKLVINSMYGFLGAAGLHFNSPENASLVTKYGRDILSKAMIWSTGEDIDFWKELEPHTEINEIPNGKDLVLVNCDTDSIMITYKDGREWTNVMRDKFLDAMNDIFDDLIVWEDDGYYDRVVVVKSKNYVLLENGDTKIKYKGSSFKSSNKEPALASMMKEISEDLINNNNNYPDIYERYINEVLNITDINRWSSKKSVTENLMMGNDTVKKKVLNAVGEKKISVGDKLYIYNDIDGKIQSTVKGEPFFYKKTGEPKMIENRVYKLSENFTGSYDKQHYLKRTFSTAEILKTVIDMSKIKNYSSTINYKKLTLGDR
jgi:DNA polymerase elongation subunit (family B)